jgi:hypothetical protein
MALIDRCLFILQERDKSAHLLSRDKSEEAFWVKDLPQDFTDFYDKWGLWEERTQAFLNTIPEGKSQAILMLFWFKSEWLPKTLFEKMLLNMAGQKKLKGQILVKLKPCQHLDTTREIIFFQAPNCNATGLRDALCRAMTKIKSGMIQKYPQNTPEWSGASHSWTLKRCKIL